jgi:hypothetical protein
VFLATTIVMIGLFVILAVVSPNFLTGTNLSSVARQTAVINIMALGMTVVIIAGGIDLSVGSILALAGLLGAMTMEQYGIWLGLITGVLAGATAGESVAPFFSAASVQNGSSRQWVFAGTDGRSRIFLNDLSTAAIIVNDWGSNLAGVQSGCGSGWQILATAPGDLNHPDSVQAFEIEGRHDEPVSSLIDLDGPMMAFWPGESSQIAHGVVQSLTTGKFEAWNMSVTCN